jgi:hypothetical protein
MRWGRLIPTSGVNSRHLGGGIAAVKVVADIGAHQTNTGSGFFKNTDPGGREALPPAARRVVDRERALIKTDQFYFHPLPVSCLWLDP